MRNNLKKIKIGVLGGAFNPPHFGHLKIAQIAKEKLKLDEIIFIPYGKPPLKKIGLAKAEDRLKMVSLLIEGVGGFKVSDYEVKKKGKSYTIETIKYLKKKYKNSEIYWIIGEDSLREIIEGKWKGKLKVLDLANFVVFLRPNSQFNLKTLPKELEKKKRNVLKKVILIKRKIPISASEIREKIKKGEKVDKFLPKKVLRYIEKRRLYE